jgi:hypothetical protein
MPKATWNGAVLAESDKTIVIEGNHLLWQEGWEGKDFQVEIAAPIKPEKRYE